jgi:hypothetical protein
VAGHEDATEKTANPIASDVSRATVTLWAVRHLAASGDRIEACLSAAN